MTISRGADAGLLGRLSDAPGPGVLQVEDRLLVAGNVQHIDLGRDLHRDPKRLPGNRTPPADGQQCDGRLQARGIQRGVRDHLAGHPPIMNVDSDEHQEECGDQQDGDPGPLGELRDQDDDQGHCRARRTKTVDRHRTAGTRTADSAPVLDHPGLREREGKECPDREKGDQAVGDPAEQDEQGTREARQHEDALRID